jgi:hypothetical protein
MTHRKFVSQRQYLHLGQDSAYRSKNVTVSALLCCINGNQSGEIHGARELTDESDLLFSAIFVLCKVENHPTVCSCLHL